MSVVSSRLRVETSRTDGSPVGGSLSIWDDMLRDSSVQSRDVDGTLLVLGKDGVGKSLLLHRLGMDQLFEDEDDVVTAPVPIPSQVSESSVLPPPLDSSNNPVQGQGQGQAQAQGQGQGAQAGSSSAMGSASRRGVGYSYFNVFDPEDGDSLSMLDGSFPKVSVWTYGSTNMDSLLSCSLNKDNFVNGHNVVLFVVSMENPSSIFQQLNEFGAILENR